MHSYIFSCLPIISLYFQNHLELSLFHALLIIGIFSLLNAIVYHGLNLIFKKHRATIAVLLSFWWLIFWFAIPVARYVLGGIQMPAVIVAYKWFVALCISMSALGVLGFCIFHFKNLSESLDKAFRVFTIIAISLVTLSGITHFRSIKGINSIKAASNHLETQYPNVYHILLDAYTNYDILKEEYGYDNSSFYQALEDLGFVCFPSSHSNYSGTLFSMSSVLNFGLIHEKFYPTAPLSPHLQASLMQKLNHNSVWQCFIDHQYHLHLLDHTTIYHSQDIFKTKLKSNHFIKTFLCITSSTIAKNFIASTFLNTYYTNHINEIHQIFQKAQKIPSTEGLNNQYVYAHILSPHEPLVFDENGETSKERTFEGILVQKERNIYTNNTQNEGYKKKYINQIRALNKLVLPVIESILDQHNSSHPPIIILHADHGRLHSSDEEEFHSLANLFAIYIPAEWREEAKNLEFVNLYRFICNHLFKLEYPYQESQYFY